MVTQVRFCCIPRKPPKSRGMRGGEGEDGWEEEQKRGCCVYTSQGGSQKATELSRRAGGRGWSPFGLGSLHRCQLGGPRVLQALWALGCGWAVSRPNERKRLAGSQ